MNWRISIAVLFVVFSACQQKKTIEGEVQIINNEGIKSDFLIEVKELKTMARQSNVKILDFRNKERYEKEHIEGALHIWRTDIEDASFPYGGMMASPAQIEALFSELGIDMDDMIVIYDDNGLCDAARLWWLLQNYDFTNVKLFHGGLDVWKENEGLVSTITPSVKKTEFKLSDSPSMKYYISKDDVQEMLNTDAIILDTRSVDEFLGKRQKSGAAKAGRIPKSNHIDWANAIDYNGDKKFKSIQELECIYSALNIKKNEPIIVYCHSGVRSAHTTFVLTQLLGYKNVKNYDGSWSEWSHFNDLAYEKDSLTTINN
jgi:thiosulfate/3-mercaptopyruvate sulfurtransferase